MGYLVASLVMFAINSDPPLGRDGAWIMERCLEFKAGSEATSPWNTKGSNVWRSVGTSIVG